MNQRLLHRRRSRRRRFPRFPNTRARTQKLHVEPLEHRILLTVELAVDLPMEDIHKIEAVGLTSVESRDQALASRIERNLISPITWNGEDVYAITGEWLVGFASPNGSLPLDAAADISPQMLPTSDGWLERLNQIAVVDDMKLFEVTRQLERSDTFLLHAAEGTGQELLRQSLEHIPGFRYLEPNLLVWAENTVPNDSRFNELWGLHNTGQTGGTADADIDAPEAWDFLRDASSVVVASIDTGVDYNHPDLAANMWTNPGEIPGDGIDNDNNGFVDDIYGIDTAFNDSDPADGHGHGTHTAGTMGAVGNNGVGVAGVNWNLQIMALKFLDDFGFGNTADAIDAIDYMTMMKRDYGVNVVASNNSWGGGGFSQALEDAIQASNDQGIMFVAAAGNNGSNTDLFPFYPSGYPLDGLIAVAATDHNDALASFSNYGAASVDLGAPGVSVLSTLPGNSYGEFDGTSMATPHVTGAVALLAAASPTATLAEIKSLILDTTDPIAALNGRTVSGGRLNLANAVHQLGLRVVASQPADGEIVFAQPQDFVFDFSHPYDPASVQAADLTVNSVAANSVSLDDADTLTFHFATSPVTVQGAQTMTIAAGAMTRQGDGALLEAFSATFRYDATLLSVTSTAPPDGSTVSAPLTSLELNFNEPVDPNSIDPADLVLNRGSVVAASPIDEDTVRYTLTGITNEEQLTLELPPGAVSDLFGNPNDRYLGTLDVDVGIVPYPLPLDAVMPNGSLVYESSIGRSISFAGDEDSFTIDLDSGQTITVVVDPASTLQPVLEVFDPSQVLAGSDTAGAAGTPAVVQTLHTTAGVYTIRVAGTPNSTGTYTLRLILNGAAEEEAYGGGANDDPAAAQSLDGAVTALASGIERAAVLGGLEPAGVDADYYSLALAAGDVASVAASSVSGNSLLLEMADEAGTALARGIVAKSADQLIQGFVVPLSGTYLLRLSGDGDYSLLVTRNADFDSEPNSSLQNPQTISASGAALGYLSTPLSSNAGNSAAGNGGSGHPGSDAQAGFVEGRLIVGFEQDLGGLTQAELVAQLGGTLIRALPIINGGVVEFTDADRGIAAIAATWTAHPLIRYAEPDFVVSALETIPNDPLFGDLWGLRNTGQNGGTTDADIDASDAWDYFTGSTSVVVASIDTGVDYTHSDLAANMWTNPNEIPGDGVDNDNNGYVDDIYGIDAANFDSDPMDDHDHGTHTAGTFGAVGNNGVGVAGINWNVQIMALKFLDFGGFGSTSGAIQVIDYMTAMKTTYGINVVASNNSWGGGGFSQALQDAIQASNDAGIMFVAAAGNYSADNDVAPSYPASYPLDGIVAVAATNSNDQLASFSNFGAESVDLGAPGVDIQSTVIGGYARFDGTSMASPHVAGAVAMLSALQPEATLAEIKSNLLNSVDLVPGLAGITVSGGRLNLNNALANLGDAGDYYSISVNSNDLLSISTTTPADGSGQPVNILDPLIELYDPSGVLVASDDNGGADGRNAQLSHTATASGLYTVRVVASAGGGEYLLQVGGNTGSGPQFAVQAVTPADGDAVYPAPSQFTVDFNDYVLLSSLQAADLLIDGLPATAIADVPDGDTVVFALPSLGEGLHSIEIVAGAIQDLQGVPIEPFQSSFYVDLSALVAYWAMGEGSGTIVGDSSRLGNDNSGTLQGDTTWSAFGLNGALEFDGQGDFVAIPDTSDINLTTVGERTVAGWFLADDISVNSRKQVIYEEGGILRGLNIYLFDGRLYAGGWNTPAEESDWQGTFFSSDQIISGRWHHVALVLDGGPTVQPGVLRAYLDGVEFGSGDGSQLWPHTGNVSIGKVDSPGDAYFHTGPDSSEEGHGLAGLIDEVRVYKRVLSPTEIQQLADEQLIGPSILSLAIAPSAIGENGGIATGTLIRTGDISGSLDVLLASSDETEAVTPPSAGFEPNQARITFAITAVDDTEVDGAQTVIISATALGLDPAVALLQVTDDEVPPGGDLVAYWAMNEGSGTIVGDSSPAGNDNSGTLQGNTAWSPLGLNGALRFDGQGDFVAIPDTSDINLITNGQRTVAGWFLADDISVNSRKQVIYEEGGVLRGLNIYLFDGRLYAGGWNTPTEESGWQGTFLSSNQITSGQWHHVALVLSGGTSVQPGALRAYLDGVEFGSGNGSQVWSHTGNVSIGKADEVGDIRFHTGADPTGEGHGLAGMIDEMRVYNRVLSVTEIQELADEQLIGPMVLSLAIDPSAIVENGGVATGTLTRTGDISGSLDVLLASSDETEAVTPPSASFEPNQFQITFAITAVDDSEVDGAQTVTISATALGVDPAVALLQVTDDDVPPEGNLVAYWAMDEGSGTIVGDSSPFGNDNSGTLQGNAAWSPLGLNGAVRFDGQGDFVAIPDTSDINLVTNGQRTVAGWFLADDISVNSRKQVIYEEGGVLRGLNIYLFDGRLYVGGWNTPTEESGWQGTFLSSNQITSGQWHHVALVLSGGPSVQPGALRAYLDGVEFGSGNGSQLWSHTGNVSVGKADEVADIRFHTGADGTGEGHGLAGLIDEMRVYNRVLSATEIQQLADEQLIDPVVLSLSIDPNLVGEDGGIATGTLTRGGDISGSLDVSLDSSDTTEAVTPPTAHFAPDQSQITFPVTAVDDNDVDGTQTVTISATSLLALDPAVALLQVTDDDLPPEGDLVAYWAMDEGSGTVVGDSSSSGNDNSGTLQGNTAWSPLGLNGALRFDGQGDFVAIPDTSDINLVTNGRRTVAGWFLADDISVSSRKQVIYEEGGVLRGLNIYLFDGRLYVGGWNTPLEESSWQGTFLSTSQITSGQWHHVALVLNGGLSVQPGALRAYLDGVEFGSGNGSQLWSHTGNVSIGKADEVGDVRFHTGIDPSAEGHGLAGLIDEMRVYNRVLSGTEIQQLAEEELNAAPVLVNNSALLVDQGSAGVISSSELLVTDANNGPQELTFTIVAAPIHGTLLRDSAPLAPGGTFTQADINAQIVTYQHDGSATSSDTFTFTVSDGSSGSIGETPFSITVLGDNRPFLYTGSLTGVSDQWQTVTLQRGYTSMVVIATPNYSNSSSPLVTRVRNATGDSFQIRLDRASNSTGAVNADVHYIVLEEGVYTAGEHGVTLEAVKFTSTTTDRRGSWTGQTRNYGNTYANPVVVGQVMSDNDPAFSVFWARGSSSTNPPSATALRVGKHVGEDPNTARADETVGYVVVEAGAGTVDGWAFVAGLGGDTIRGVGNGPPFAYSPGGPPSATTAVVSLAGMDGGDGGWAILYGANPVSANQLNLAIDEDQMGDNERNHTTEQVAYLVLASTGAAGVSSAAGDDGAGAAGAVLGLAPAMLGDTPGDAWVVSRSEPRYMLSEPSAQSGEKHLETADRWFAELGKERTEPEDFTTIAADAEAEEAARDTYFEQLEADGDEAAWLDEILMPQ